MNLDTLQKEVTEWANRNFPNTPPYRPLLGLVEEVGELSHAHLKMEQGIRGTAQEHKIAKEDAIGDILVYLCHYCSLNGLDLDYCVTLAWGEVKKRDWQANPHDGSKGGEIVKG
jgi:NTP pyrophosphatase (non-canonical NTP hydrolase)